MVRVGRLGGSGSGSGASGSASATGGSGSPSASVTARDGDWLKVTSCVCAATGLVVNRRSDWRAPGRPLHEGGDESLEAMADDDDGSQSESGEEGEEDGTQSNGGIEGAERASVADKDSKDGGKDGGKRGMQFFSRSRSLRFEAIAVDVSPVVLQQQR